MSTSLMIPPKKLSSCRSLATLSTFTHTLEFSTLRRMLIDKQQSIDSTKETIKQMQARITISHGALSLLRPKEIEIIRELELELLELQNFEQAMRIRELDAIREEQGEVVAREKERQQQEEEEKARKEQIKRTDRNRVDRCKRLWYMISKVCHPDTTVDETYPILYTIAKRFYETYDEGMLKMIWGQIKEAEEAKKNPQSLRANLTSRIRNVQKVNNDLFTEITNITFSESWKITAEYEKGNISEALQKITNMWQQHISSLRGKLTQQLNARTMGANLNTSTTSSTSIHYNWKV